MAPFTVLHVCMGNICRSPMAERLTARAVREIAGERGADLVLSHSAGTGDWHVGQAMNPPAARQVTARGGDHAGFAARKLLAQHIDAADLVLTATGEQLDYVTALRADAADRTFVLGQFGRLLTAIDPTELPPDGGSAQGIYARGVAIVAAADAVRGARPPLPEDDLEDPWGRGEALFGRVAAEIEYTVQPFIELLLAGQRPDRRS